MVLLERVVVVKQQVGKVVLGLEKATDGHIIYKDEDVTQKSARKKT